MTDMAIVFLGGLYCALLVALGIAYDQPVIVMLSMGSLGTAYLNWQAITVADDQIAWHRFAVNSLAWLSLVLGVMATVTLLLILL